MKASDFGRFGGSLTADVLTFNPDAIPAPDTLVIRMTRCERRIADELRRRHRRNAIWRSWPCRGLG